jgi:hypothetical protein
MAINAESHLEAMTLESVHGLHRAVAFLTGKLFPYVTLMIEQYVLRKIVDLFPGCRRVVVEIPVLLLDPGMIGNYVFVAMQTLFHRRQSRMIGVAHVGMTVQTLDLLYANMQLMAEGYGLFRADVRSVTIKKVEKKDHP